MPYISFQWCFIFRITLSKRSQVSEHCYKKYSSIRKSFFSTCKFQKPLHSDSIDFVSFKCSNMKRRPPPPRIKMSIVEYINVP